MQRCGIAPQIQGLQHSTEVYRASLACLCQDKKQVLRITVNGLLSDGFDNLFLEFAASPFLLLRYVNSFCFVCIIYILFVLHCISP